MQRTLVALFAPIILIGAWMMAFAQDERSVDPNISVMDNCDPADPAWNPTGGCTQKPAIGTVTFAEFGALLFQPAQPGFPIGHPSWRNEPPYLAAQPGRAINVVNRGGRDHTFTRVVNYAGGVVIMLNGALPTAPECLVPGENSEVMPPGYRKTITGLATGTHKFQCCIHPWMRAAIDVQ